MLLLFFMETGKQKWNTGNNFLRSLEGPLNINNVILVNLCRSVLEAKMNK